MSPQESLLYRVSRMLRVFEKCNFSFRAVLLPLIFCFGLASGASGATPVVSVRTAAHASQNGPHGGVFEFTRTGDAGQPLTVEYVLGGTARNGYDYQYLSNCVTFPAGQRRVQVRVIPNGPAIQNAEQTLQLRLLPDKAPFCLAIFPDTQYYACNIWGQTTNMYMAETTWVQTNHYASNIVFAMHLGDITDQNSVGEWKNAQHCMGILDGVVPYSLCVGNHDGASGSPQNDTELLNRYFPVSRYESLPIFGGVFASNIIDNAYWFFHAGGVDWLVISLPFGPKDEALDWAGQIATNHPNHQVILVTHTYLYSDNRLHGYPNQPFKPTDYARPNNGTDIWEKFVRRCPNVVMVLNGHVPGTGTGRLVSKNDAGKPVYQMLSDYQDYAGGGYLRCLRVFPQEDRFTVGTYSPDQHFWLTNGQKFSWTPANNPRSQGEHQFEYTNAGLFTNFAIAYLITNTGTEATMVLTNLDLTPPSFLAPQVLDAQTLLTTFSEPLEAASATNATHYALSDNIAIGSTKLSADAQSVTLALNPAPRVGSKYTLNLSGLADPSGNTFASDTNVTFEFWPPLLQESFDNTWNRRWQIVDQGAIAGPSQWAPVGRSLVQRSYIAGPSGAFNEILGRKGTFALYKDTNALAWDDYHLGLDVYAAYGNAFGILLRCQNPSNYYKLEFDLARYVNNFYQVTKGAEKLIASCPVGFARKTFVHLDATVVGTNFLFELDGYPLFQGPLSDDALPQGTFGLYCWHASEICFSNLVVAPVSGLPQGPKVRLNCDVARPPDTANATVTLNASAISVNADIQTIDLLTNGVIMGTFAPSDFPYVWTEVPPGQYYVQARATDADGATGLSSTAFFLVEALSPPVFVQQPSDQLGSPGGAAMFSARASSVAPVDYQWYFGPNPLPDENSATLVLNNLRADQAGDYYLVAVNFLGAVTSQVAHLIITAAAPLKGPQPLLHVSGFLAANHARPLLLINKPIDQFVQIDTSTDLRTWRPFAFISDPVSQFYLPDDTATAGINFYRATLTNAFIQPP